MTRPSVLMIGLDAADAGIVEQLVRSGHMPNLKRLREAGRSGSLNTPAGLFAGGVWPTFYTGRSVTAHGVYHSKLWRPERMLIDVASDEWLAARPFWETLSDVSVCAVDVPMVLGAPRPVNGVYLGGWGTHDLISSGAWPRALWQECERKFGRPLMPAEHFGMQSQQSVADLPRALNAATRQVAAIAASLLQRERYDLSCVVFGGAHRAGHYLWDRSQLGGPAEPDPERVQDALVQVHAEIDRALGTVLDCVSDETLVIAFAVHGMGVNPGWSDLLPDILTAVEQHRSGASPRRGALFRLKQRLPFHWARPVLKRLPLPLQQRLVSIWSKNMFDWSVTRWFPLPMDEAGYLRINLRGRERDGIVESGAEYDALCTELTDLLLSLHDVESGEPIARTVVRAYADAPADAPARSLLPDLVVPWDGPVAAQSSRLVSPLLPGFEYRVPRRLPSGRSGNHTSRAWFSARGPGVTPGAMNRTHDVVDLVPTVLRHLGIAAAPDLDGTAIDLNGAP